MKFFTLTASLCLISHIANATESIPTPDLLNKATQLIVVTTDAWDGYQGKIQRFIRKNPAKSWSAVGSTWDVIVGAKGLAWAPNLEPYQLQGPFKIEGDKKSPAGVFSLNSAFGFSDIPDPKIRFSYIPITATTVCVDDQNSKNYGRIIDSAKISSVDWKSAEVMSQYPQQYAQGIVINYNIHGQWPGKGSCIFLHVKKEPSGTTGCTVMTKENITDLLHWLDPMAKPVLIQLPKTQYKELQISWHLPPI